MIKRVKPSIKMPASKRELQRVRVNRDGYDASGAYWGAGPDVFIATTIDGADEITVRARTIAEARAKIAAELARLPGKAQEQREPLGGTAPRKSRFQIDWRNPVTGATIRIRITHARDYLIAGTDHVEIESIAPKRAALPITETGYRSHFISALDLINAGGPITFVTTWLNSTAAGPAWRKQATKAAQGDLFKWAEAQTEVGTRTASKSKSRPTPPRAKPRRKRARDRDPE